MYRATSIVTGVPALAPLSTIESIRIGPAATTRTGRDEEIESWPSTLTFSTAAAPGFASACAVTLIFRPSAEESTDTPDRVGVSVPL